MNRQTHRIVSKTKCFGDYKGFESKSDCCRDSYGKIKETIEKRIYEAFASFGEERDIKIVDFLNRLDLKELEVKKYRRSKFSYESLLKSILLKKLKHLKLQTHLVRYLKNNRKDAQKLGFKKVPDQRTISYFINHILDKNSSELIDYAVSKIEEIADKFGIIFDVEAIQIEKPKKETPKKSLHYKKKKKAREVCRLFRKKLFPFINLNMGPNCIYKKNDFLDLMIHLALTQDFAENGSKTFQEKRDSVPDGDTLLYHLKEYPNFKDLQRMFITLFEIIWEMARKANLFKGKVNIAIDLTDWLFYGDKNTPMVVGGKYDRGTSYRYRFATVNIVEAGKRFTLLALPVGPLARKEDILKKLLRYTLRRIRVRRVYLDRGFFSGDYISVIDDGFHLKFLMPCTSNSRIKKLMEIVPAPSVIRDYSMGKARFNVVIVEDEKGEKRAFATNVDYDENDLGLSKRLFSLYGNRWGIETSYRVKKHSFRPKTTSKNYLIRLFYFLFSVLLYNLWILLDVLICLSLIGKKIEKHLITSKLFGTIFSIIDPG